MSLIKDLVKSIVPAWILRLYHRGYALATPLLFGQPGKRLTIIGVTGTNGKSTTVAMIGHILKSSGIRTAWMSTATERIGDREWLNDRKMTMPGHGALQKFLAAAQKDGCTHAVIEVSSQGVSQFRDLGIPFDVAAFLNITPEHIEAHGSFNSYKDAKISFFRHLASRRVKKFGEPQTRSVVINIDDPWSMEFFTVKTEQSFAFSRQGKSMPGYDHVFIPHDVRDQHGSITFTVDGVSFDLPMFGLFNCDNALAAIACCRAVGVSLEKCANGLRTFPGVPGRLEFIQRTPFSVLVDYAPEPASLAALYSVIETIPHKRIIHVFGSAGGGRDTARRPVMGSYVGERADVAIVTNEDPYDENPQNIIQQIVEGIRRAGKLEFGKTFFTIEDRREAIRLALTTATEGDLVVVTGKACEQWIMGKHGKKTPWDDRRIIREELGLRTA